MSKKFDVYAALARIGDTIQIAVHNTCDEPIRDIQVVRLDSENTTTAVGLGYPPTILPGHVLTLETDPQVNPYTKLGTFWTNSVDGLRYYRAGQIMRCNGPT
jgi:hypothetical protein